MMHGSQTASLVLFSLLFPVLPSLFPLSRFVISISSPMFTYFLFVDCILTCITCVCFGLMIVAVLFSKDTIDRPRFLAWVGSGVFFGKEAGLFQRECVSSFQFFFYFYFFFSFSLMPICMGVSEVMLDYLNEIFLI